MYHKLRVNTLNKEIHDTLRRAWLIRLIRCLVMRKYYICLVFVNGMGFHKATGKVMMTLSEIHIHSSHRVNVFEL